MLSHRISLQGYKVSEFLVVKVYYIKLVFLNYIDKAVVVYVDFAQLKRD